MSAAAIACIGEPISWLRLETFALRGGDASVADHVASCSACRQCLEAIERDAVVLPALPAFERAKPARHPRWWMFAVPALAAAVIAIVIVRPRPEPAARRENLATIKGVGDIVLGVVRDRGGVIRDDVTTFAPGDRWKIVVTCAADHAVWLELVVDDGHAVDHPLPPAHVACGNGVVVPGAFELTGHAPNRVCAHLGTDATDATDLGGHVACVTITPEP